MKTKASMSVTSEPVLYTLGYDDIVKTTGIYESREFQGQFTVVLEPNADGTRALLFVSPRTGAIAALRPSSWKVRTFRRRDDVTLNLTIEGK